MHKGKAILRQPLLSFNIEICIDMTGYWYDPESTSSQQLHTFKHSVIELNTMKESQAGRVCA